MIRKTISMPDAMDEYIQTRVKTGQYGNDSEYLRDLVRKDKEEQDAIVAVQTMIDEAMASGVSNRTVGEIFEDAKRTVAARHRRA